MKGSDWVEVDLDNDIKSNWERFTNKLKLKNQQPKPKGLQRILELNEGRYTSPPYPYNLRKLERRCIYEK